MRIVLVGPFDNRTGYGQDLLGLAELLSRWHDVQPYPTSCVPGMPPAVAGLFTKAFAPPYDLAIMHVPPHMLKVPESVRANTTTVIGWSMWERTRLDPVQMADADVTPADLAKLDMLLAYDPVSREAFEDFAPDVFVRTLQGGVNTEEFTEVDRDWHGTFRFGMLGQLTPRKDPFVAIEAFSELQADGAIPEAELHLKTSIFGLHPKLADSIPNLHIDTSMATRRQIRDWYADKHVLLAPSRGEGKNLPALEMQLTGGVTLATGWGGHTMWQHPAYAPAIDFALEEDVPGSGSYSARADKEHLKELMVERYGDRAGTRQMGKAAAAAIRQTCSWEAVSQRLMRVLGECHRHAAA